MAKLTVICPSYLFSGTRVGAAIVQSGRLPSIGVAYLGAALREKGHDVRVIDAVGLGIQQFVPLDPQKSESWTVHGLTPEEIIERIPSDTRIIGLTCMFSCEWRLYKSIVLKIRERFPDQLLVLGGEHATADWDAILSMGIGVDACVIGEGEETVVELADVVEAGGDWRPIAGIARLHEGRPLMNGRRKRMSWSSQLLPAWDLFPIRSYLKHGSGMNNSGGACLPILASRGCPYSCTFCSSPQMWGHSYVAREPEAIVAEMLHWKAIYPVEHFIFVDLAMTIKKQWTLDLARLMKEKNVGATWHFGPGTRTEVMSDEVIDALKESGLTKIGFASESGSEKTLAKVQKRVNLKKMVQSMKYASSIGLSSKSTLIYGFPGQTLRDCLANVLFGAKLAWAGVDEINIPLFSPYPGTQLHKELVERKLIPDKTREPERYEQFLDQLAHDDLGARSWSEHVPSWMLPIFYWVTHLLFLGMMYTSHPSKILRLYKRLRAKDPVTGPEQRLLQLLSR